MDKITDYAQYLIRLDQLSKEIHDLCLKRDFLAANSLAILAVAEMRMLSATLVLMDAKQ